MKFMKISLLFFSYPLLLSAQQPPTFEVSPLEVKQHIEWGDRKKQLENSFNLWLKVKNDCRGNYSYAKKWSSWTGSSQTTTIIVSNNRVTERKFESMSAPHPGGRPVDKNRWTERGEFIGSSSNKQAHPPQTLDQHYAEAKELLAKPIPPFHRGFLRLNEQGLLLSCFVQDTRIADDAPVTGVNITSIALGNQKDPHPKNSPPTFEEWVANGKKLPEGMMFIGGSPWFNESTGQKRTPGEVYQIIYGKNKKTPATKPNRPQLNPNKRKPFPKHWGDPPKRQTRDLRPLPGGYGMGSGTLANWIQENLDRDKERVSKPD
jgi:hypothetical protein